MQSSKTECTILVVDDSQTILNLYRHFLESADYPVLTALSGSEALEKIETTCIAVILSDHVMPKMTGLELLETIRKTSPDTLRIMITGHPSEQLEVDAVSLASVHRFLTKPVAPLVLLETVASAVMLYENTSRSREAGSDEFQNLLDETGLDLADLKPGMVLSHDAYSVSGSLVLSKYADLTESRIQYIREHHQKDPLIGDLYVYTTSIE